MSRLLVAGGRVVDPSQKLDAKLDVLLPYCFHYDPESGRYGVVVMNLIRLGGVVTVALLAGFILLMRRRETRTHAEGRA